MYMYKWCELKLCGKNIKTVMAINIYMDVIIYQSRNPDAGWANPG